MSTPRLLAGAVPAVLLLLVGAASAPACGFPTPRPADLIMADVVVVGRVESIEEKPVVVPKALNEEPDSFKVVTVSVTQGIKGADGLKKVKVGLKPFQHLGGKDEAVFFLVRHPTQPFFVTASDEPPMLRVFTPRFNERIKKFELWARLLADPVVGLNSDKADERLLTAELLLARHVAIKNSGRPSGVIDPKLSRHALLILADADWKGGSWEDYELRPEFLFDQVRRNDKGEWQGPPLPVNDKDHTAARAWLRENAATVRLLG
jgi:hypothetical protein